MSELELKNDKVDLAKQLKAIRAEAGMSMDELSERSGLGRNQLITIEKGTGNPTLETLFKYLDAAGGKLVVESQW